MSFIYWTNANKFVFTMKNNALWASLFNAWLDCHGSLSLFTLIVITARRSRRIAFDRLIFEAKDDSSLREVVRG